MSSQEARVERRGVQVIVEIADTADPEYVAVSVFVEGDRIASRDSRGESYGPDYGGRYRATPSWEPNPHTILYRTVLARDLYTAADSIYEWGWHPQPDPETRGT